MRAAIIANGVGADSNFIAKNLSNAELIIAADGGMSILKAIGVTPDICVGDMDSYTILDNLDALPYELISLPVEKDFTDLQFALEVAIDRKASSIEVYNAFGGRLDHLLNNVNLLRYYRDSHVDIELIDREQRLSLLRKRQVVNLHKGQIFSIVPMTDLKGLTISGAKYPLVARDVKAGSSLCQSNIAMSESVSIELGVGDAWLVINNEY